MLRVMQSLAPGPQPVGQPSAEPATSALQRETQPRAPAHLLALAFGSHPGVLEVGAPVSGAPVEPCSPRSPGPPGC